MDQPLVKVRVAASTLAWLLAQSGADEVGLLSPKEASIYYYKPLNTTKTHCVFRSKDSAIVLPMVENNQYSRLETKPGDLDNLSIHYNNMYSEFPNNAAAEEFFEHDVKILQMSEITTIPDSKWTVLVPPCTAERYGILSYPKLAFKDRCLVVIDLFENKQVYSNIEEYFLESASKKYVKDIAEFDLETKPSIELLGQFNRRVSTYENKLRFLKSARGIG